MSPEQLKLYLDVLRASGAMSAHVKFSPNSGDEEIAVVFGPEPMTMMAPAEPLTPGGWKGPAKLDQDYEIEELPPLVEQTYKHPE